MWSEYGNMSPPITDKLYPTPINPTENNLLIFYTKIITRCMVCDNETKAHGHGIKLQCLGFLAKVPHYLCWNPPAGIMMVGISYNPQFIRVSCDMREARGMSAWCWPDQHVAEIVVSWRFPGCFPSLSYMQISMNPSSDDHKLLKAIHVLQFPLSCMQGLLVLTGYLWNIADTWALESSRCKISHIKCSADLSVCMNHDGWRSS